MNSFLHTVYNRLLAAYGPQHWWPADTPFEVIVGAFLTQNTAWRNVEQAIANLRSAGALELQTLYRLPREQIESLIRPAGFFRQKAQRLQQFTTFIQCHYKGRLDPFLHQPLVPLRTLLLARPGIGPETADAILLYAGNHASFVVDAYTRRLLERLNQLPQPAGYEEMRALFMRQLPTEAALFNEYHALIVQHAKDRCHKRQPRCAGCPLLDLCPFGMRVHAGG